MTKTRQTLKPSPQLSSHHFALSRFVTLKALALIYFIAFASMSVQITGLIGIDGILPVDSLLRAVFSKYDTEGFSLLPTLFWIDDSNATLVWSCYAGMIVSVLGLIGFCQPLCFGLLWVLYLSIVNVSGAFTGFQWDILLLEAGFLAIFYSPWQTFSSRHNLSPPSLVIHLLFYVLIFKLMFSSGAVKLLSQDPAWRDLTALKFHYETQPLPHLMSWFVHQLPEWSHQLSTAVMFIVELVLPFFIFIDRRLRHLAAMSFIVLMLIVMSTGNYGFFNLLTIALALPLLDDRFYDLFVKIPVQSNPPSSPSGLPVFLKQISLASIGLLILTLSLTQSSQRLLGRWEMPQLITSLHQAAAPYHLTSSYGLFAVMTKTRPEIVIQGSLDGITWQDYSFKWKPGDQSSVPKFLLGHMPRLDWQMWFAALSTYDRQQWYQNLMVRLLQGKQDVLDLFATNPFPDVPPLLVRSQLYQYRFSDFEDFSKMGYYWNREFVGLYHEPIKIR